MTPVRLNPRPFGLESSTLPLSHCAPSKKTRRRDARLCLAHERYVFAVKQFGRLSSVTILLYFKAANTGVDNLNEQL